MEGLNVVIEMPEAFDPSKERSMVVILHGAGGTEVGMARSLAHLTKLDYVVVAPKSTAATWSEPDLAAVRKITADLKKRLRVGERRLHGVGFSNGGWNLAPVAFDEGLRFQSATWIAAGFNGGKVPKHAKKEMLALAMAGAEDANRTAAEKTPSLLADKVRSAEARIQPNLGHEWTDKLIPYFTWWLGVAEGRFVPGDCAAFEWKEPDVGDDGVRAPAAADGKAGGFVYWYSAADATNGPAGAANEKAKTLQNDVFRDALVQRFGNQLSAAKADREAMADAFTKAGLKTTPANVVYDAAGKVKATLQDKIDAKALAAALRSVAPDKTIPKD
jgi:predicted esterase